MTTPWNPEPIWQGKTVAVMGSGPSLTPAVAEALRGYPTIVVNNACRLAPWADVLVAVDGDWLQEWREFAGTKLCGVDVDTLDAFYIGHRCERATVAGRAVEFRNSGLTAVRIAAQMGASRILLAGFDGAFGGSTRYFYDDEVDSGEGAILAAGMQQVIADLAANGVTVQRYEPPPKPRRKQSDD